MLSLRLINRNLIKTDKMENINEKIKRLRREVAKTFMLLFAPHLMVCVITSQVTTDPMGNIKWQLCWFATYFTIAFFVYVFAPKIVKKRNGSNGA